jgi:hypothetical protein
MSLTPITKQSADRVCAIVISKYGLGKTSLIRTIFGQIFLAETNAWSQINGDGSKHKVCVLAAEPGLLAVKDLVDAGLIEGYEIKSLAEFKEAYQLLATVAEMKDRYDWIFIDSLSEISERCYESMKEQYPNRSDSFKLWGDYSDMMKMLVKGFRDLLTYNVVFTALETVDKDENNIRYISPAVAGKDLKEKLPSYFDEVLYLQEVTDDNGVQRRVFYTQPSGRYPAKDRSGKLAPVEQPNLLTIHSKILGG